MNKNKDIIMYQLLLYTHIKYQKKNRLNIIIIIKDNEYENKNKIEIDMLQKISETNTHKYIKLISRNKINYTPNIIKRIKN